MATPAAAAALLLAVTIIVAVLLAAGAAYLVFVYQHPDDARGAWLPKIVVVLSVWISGATVLLFPLDVANRAACASGLLPFSAAAARGEAGGDAGSGGGSSCRLTLPMRQMWHAAFFTLLGLAYLVCPFTLFFYEGDSE
jgi:LMBR1 domain-containing protein 1